MPPVSAPVLVAVALDVPGDGQDRLPEVHQAPGHAAAASASSPHAPPAIVAAPLSVGVVAMAA